MLTYEHQRILEIKTLAEKLLPQNREMMNDEQANGVKVILSNCARYSNLLSEIKNVEDTTSIVTHYLNSFEFKSPLTSIRGYANFLSSETLGLLAEDQKGILNRIYELAGEMQAITHLLSYTVTTVTQIINVARRLQDLDVGVLSTWQTDFLERILLVSSNMLKEYLDWPNWVERFDLSEIFEPNSLFDLDAMKRNYRSGRTILLANAEFILAPDAVNLPGELNEEQKQLVIQLRDLAKSLFEGPYE